MSEEIGWDDPEEALGPEFWAQPEDVLETTFSLIYAQVAAVLRDEYRDRGGTALDLLIIERLASIYARLRMQEAGIGVEEEVSTKERRETNKEFIDFALSIKKLWATQDAAYSGEIIKRKLNAAIKDAFSKMSSEDATKLQKVLAESFAEQGV